MHVSASPGERGSATAETAVLLPVLLVVLAAAVGVLVCVSAQLRCVDAARIAARAAARGDASLSVEQSGVRVAPPGAVVRQVIGEDTVEVVVTARVHPFGHVLAVLPAVEVRGRAIAPLEDLPG